MAVAGRQNPVLGNWLRLYENPTRAEKLLEPEIAKLGLVYRYQHKVWNYLLDFCLLDLKIAIEADGPNHNRPAQREKDKRRTEWLEKRGWRVVRLTNDEIYRDPAATLKRALLPLCDAFPVLREKLGGRES